MTDEELAAIDKRLDTLSQRKYATVGEALQASIDAPTLAYLARTLLAEAYFSRAEKATLVVNFDKLSAQYALARDRWQAGMERAAAQVAAMRPIVEAVANRAWYTHSSTLGGTLKQYACCTFEECEQESAEGSRHIPHKSGCPVTQARALLAKEE